VFDWAGSLSFASVNVAMQLLPAARLRMRHVILTPPPPIPSQCCSADQPTSYWHAPADRFSFKACPSILFRDVL